MKQRDPDLSTPRRYGMIIALSFLGFLVLLGISSRDSRLAHDRIQRQLDAVHIFSPLQKIIETALLFAFDLFSGSDAPLPKNASEINRNFMLLIEKEQDLRKQTELNSCFFSTENGFIEPEDLARYWKNIEIKQDDLEAMKLETLNIFQDFVRLSECIGESSGLNRSSQISVSYLSEILSIRIPESFHLFLQILAFTSEDLQTDFQKGEFASLIAFLRSNIEQVRILLKKFGNTNIPVLSSYQISEHLEIAFRPYYINTGLFLNEIEETALGEADLSKIHYLGSSCVNAGIAFWRQTEKELQQVIASHIQYERNLKYFYVSAGVGVLFFSFFFSYLFSRIR